MNIKEISIDMYNGLKCVLCGESFQDNDEVVFCPKCGAPHHKSCYAQVGDCALAATHGTDDQYKAPTETKENVEGQSVGGDTQWTTPSDRDNIVCEFCGTVNPRNGLFCTKCGNSLKKQSGAGSPFSGEEGKKFNTRMTSPFISYNSMPYGGLNPEEELNGVTVRDLATFIGQNGSYYLPRFKSIAKGNKININISAFLFTWLYFLYRKIYGLGILILVLDLILGIPSFVLTYNDLVPILGLEFNFSEQLITFMENWYNISFYLTLIMRIFCGLFANQLYFHKAVRTIKKYKAEYRDEQAYNLKLSQAGSVNMKIIIAILLLPIALYILMTIVSVFVALIN